MHAYLYPPHSKANKKIGDFYFNLAISEIFRHYQHFMMLIVQNCQYQYRNVSCYTKFDACHSYLYYSMVNIDSSLYTIIQTALLSLAVQTRGSRLSQKPSTLDTDHTHTEFLSHRFCSYLPLQHPPYNLVVAQVIHCSVYLTILLSK